MRARQASQHALFILSIGLISSSCVLADGPSPAPRRRAIAPAQSPAASPPKAEASPAPMPILAQPSATAPAVAPATRDEAVRAGFATDVRLKELKAAGAAEKPATRPIREILEARRRLLADWDKATRDCDEAEHPKVTPEGEAAESKAELEKAQALIEQAAKAPDALLPEAFGAAVEGRKPPEARLAEMKEAIDSARTEIKERSTELEHARTEGTKALAANLAALRSGRDRAYQACAAQAARRGEREAAVSAAAAPEARDIARERLTNDDWESRVESVRLAVAEARIATATKRLDLGSINIQARAARVQLSRRLIERMEERYAALAERQRVELKRAVAQEQTRAAQAGDPLDRYRAKRTAELLELESQAVAYEKANATTGGLSIAEQTALADAGNDNFMDLKRLIGDGSVSPLDALRLKNDFRRIGPERAQIIRTDLAASDAELTGYENALTDAEIDLVNDSRDDRFERETLLEQVPEGRRREAKAMLDELEIRHKTLLDRRRAVLQKLARRAEGVHNQVLRRVGTLDEQYAFIRTHIFWVRDAEPVGPATVAHARDESIRAARALARLACEPWDRALWGRATPEFILAVAAVAVLPWPLHLARKALDRRRLAAAPDAAVAPADLRGMVDG